MKKMIFIMALLALAFPAFAKEAVKNTGALTRIEAQYVCMINDAAFAKPQIAIVVGGKTYYGCCKMCKERLTNDPSSRTATDPVSGKSVDKADAVIGKAADGTVYYFENEKNMKQYKAPVKADATSHH